jgi:methyl-accepting chemotaxis protein
MQTIASGDLRSPAQGTVWSDEFGEIVSAIDKMRCGLRELIVAVTASVERLAGASEEISAATTEAAKGSETQRSETGQASTAVHQMSSAVLQVTDHSQHAAEAARKTSAKAHEGGEIITKTIADMRSIAGTVTGSGNKVKELGVRSEQIGKIVNVIDEIADQTNLLALNAAIEAARAGDQGRGFAVVADEVRKLAERTTKATKEISEMVQAIQTETNDAVSAMKLGTQQAENGVQATAGATAALQEIIQMADQLEGMITQIATAATQQSSAAEEVNGTLKRITTVVGESAGAAQHTAQACQDLANLAVDLQNIVGRFRVDTEAQEAQEARRRTSRHRPEGDGRPRAERPDGSAVLAAHDGRPAVH